MFDGKSPVDPNTSLESGVTHYNVKGNGNEREEEDPK